MESICTQLVALTEECAYGQGMVYNEVLKSRIMAAVDWDEFS